MKRDGSMPDDLAEVIMSVCVILGALVAVIAALATIAKRVYN